MDHRALGRRALEDMGIRRRAERSVSRSSGSDRRGLAFMSAQTRPDSSTMRVQDLHDHGSTSARHYRTRAYVAELARSEPGLEEPVSDASHPHGQRVVVERNFTVTSHTRSLARTTARYRVNRRGESRARWEGRAVVEVGMSTARRATQRVLSEKTGGGGHRVVRRRPRTSTPTPPPIDTRATAASGTSGRV